MLCHEVPGWVTRSGRALDPGAAAAATARSTGGTRGCSGFGALAVGGDPGAAVLVVAGEYKLGEPIVRECTKRLSKYPHWMHHALMLCHLVRGEYEDALIESDAFKMSGLLWSPLDHAIALAYLGIADKARKAYADACEIQPEIAVNPRRYIGWFILDDNLVDEIMVKLRSHQLLESA